jgi:hypothetical protein
MNTARQRAKGQVAKEYLPDRRQRQKIAKSILVEFLGDIYEVVSVANGKGTASGWLHIKTKHAVPIEVKTLIEWYLDKKIGLASYYPEMSSEPDFCVNWTLT